jgi:3-keto-5-aminohexanoate cleavage enzyme
MARRDLLLVSHPSQPQGHSPGLPYDHTMRRRTPVIIEAAINGATLPSANPHVPRTPDEIAVCAIECLDRGAAIVHNHNDEPNVGGPPCHDPEPYATAWTQVLQRHPHALLHPTVRGMSPDAPIEGRYSHLDALFERGLLPMASADPGVVSIGPWIYGNSSSDAEYMFDWCRTRDMPVHVSVFEPGFLRAVLHHRRIGTLPRRTKIQLYFGDRLPFGLPPTIAALNAYGQMLDDTGLPWMVGVMGGDVLRDGFADAAIERGGHLRVGLEDFGGRRTPCNEDLVSEAVQLVALRGLEVATCEQALNVLSADPDQA